MSAYSNISDKCFDADGIELLIKKWKDDGYSIIFTNGCFDLLHLGHIDYLSKASDLGDKLILGLNSDDSVQRLKGKHRPLQNEESRKMILGSLQFVDAVVVFKEDTPIELIQRIQPDVLVKGGDYTVETVVGADIVTAYGGRVELIPFVQGHSTSNIEKKIRRQ